MQSATHISTPSEYPLVAYDESKSEAFHLINAIKKWRGEETLEFSHFLTRRDRTFAITRADQQIYWMVRGSSCCCKLENRTKVYFVACSYGHFMFVVDYVDEMGNIVPYNAYGYVDHQLPNGHCYKLPRKSSVIGLKLHGSAELYGQDQPSISIGSMASDNSLQGCVHMRDIEKCLEVGEYVVYINCAAYTSIILTSSGRLLFGGSNGFGELGVAGIEKSEKIDVHPIHSENPSLFFCKVACGDHNIAAITKEGLLYVTGYNSSNELGLKTTNSVFKLQPSILFNVHGEKDPFIDVACHYYGIIVLGKLGNVYVSGGGEQKVEKVSPSVSQFTKYSFVGSNSSNLFAVSYNETSILLTQLTREGSNVYNSVQPYTFDTSRNAFSITGSEYHTMTCILLRNETSHTKLQSNLSLHLSVFNGDCEKTLSDIVIKV